MPTVSEVCDFLDHIAPPDLAEEWDNVGLLVGRRSRSVAGLLTCLTLTPDVAEEALRRQAQMVVTHHPVLFRGTRVLNDQAPEGRMLLDLIEGGVAVYSAHTRYDSAPDGINQQLAESLGLTDIRPLRPRPENPESGSGRLGCMVSGSDFRDLLRALQKTCHAPFVQYCGDPDRPVGRVAVACGSAAEFLADAVENACDTFVTGEARFHAVLDALQQGVRLVLTGHYASERFAMEHLANVLARRFPEIQVQASSVESGPLKAFPGFPAS